MIPIEALEELAQHYEAGAIKYSDRNWEKGLPLSTFYNSLIRHITASYMRGAEDENHEAAAVWNAVGYLTTLRRLQEGQLPDELDDRPIERDRHSYAPNDVGEQIN